MIRLFQHWLPLKEQMKDRTINYVDLLCPYLLFARSKEDPIPQVSKRLVKDERAT